MTEVNHFEVYRNADPLPRLIGQADYTLTLTLAEHEFGWNIAGKSSKLLSSAMDLTGATVNVVISSLPHESTVASYAGGYGDVGRQSILDKNATIIDAINGKCAIELSNTDTANGGDYVGEIKVTKSNGKVVKPGFFRFTLLMGLN